MGLLVVALPAYMVERGVSALAIGGFISAVVLPWTLKLFFAPLMERYTFLSMGRRRPWILIGTLGGALAYAAAAMLVNPLEHFGVFTAIIVLASTFLALQDIATGALACEVLPAEDMPQANSFMWGSEIIGVATASAVGAWVLHRFQLSTTLFAVACLVSLVLFIPLAFKERNGERLLPWTAGNASAFAKTYHARSWKDLWKKLKKVVFLPTNLLVLVLGVALHFNEGLIDGFGPVFTVRELNWSAQSYMYLRAASQLAGGIAGILTGGLLIKRYGFQRGIQFGILAATTISLAMALLKPFWGVAGAVEVYFISISIVQAIIAIIFFATAMRLCWKPVAGIQFSLFMALANLGYMLGSGLMGSLIELVGPQGIHAAMALFACLAMALSLRLDIAKSLAHIASLDKKLYPLLQEPAIHRSIGREAA